jgi:leucyl-tRNA synthetase
MEPDAKEADREGVNVRDVADAKACWTGGGSMIRSANDEGLDINGMDIETAKQATIQWLFKHNAGNAASNYKLRDWLFSRQRYWGEPFPVAHMQDGEIKVLDEDELPVLLPEIKDFQPTGTGESPLAKAQDWLIYTDPKTGESGRRETHTMPQWAGSCWYYLRFIDPNNSDAPWGKELEHYWMPVDLYVGGAEHAVLHLLYARFWHKVLFDLGWVKTSEPFKKLVNQGMILGISYKTATGVLVPTDQVEEKNNKFFHSETGEELAEFPAKMSKSLKNVVNPDDIISKFGADSFRLYEMFMGPLEAVKPWNSNGVEGMRRFLQRAWRMIIGDDGKPARQINDKPLTKEQRQVLHFTIKKVTDDLESLDINTAISQLMIFVNKFHLAEDRNREAMEIFVKLLSPLAPHIAEELWQRMGKDETIAYDPWPEYNEDFIRGNSVEILVQILGKPKARIMMAGGLTLEEMEKITLADESVKEVIGDKTVKKVICVPGRLVNIVV